MDSLQTILTLPHWHTFFESLFAIGVFYALWVTSLLVINRSSEFVDNVFCFAIYASARAVSALGRLTITLLKGLFKRFSSAAHYGGRMCARAGMMLLGTQIKAYRARVEARERQEKLREIWVAEYQDEYATFEEFVDAFENAGRPGNQSAPHPSTRFTDACRVLGLAEDGRFSRADLEARFRELISKAHPDRGGKPGQASRLNVARDAIKREKGWV